MWAQNISRYLIGAFCRWPALHKDTFTCHWWNTGCLPHITFHHSCKTAVESITAITEQPAVAKRLKAVLTVIVVQGGHKVGEKNSEFSRLFQSHKLTFPQVIATKSKHNNDLHQGSFYINSSNITGHHRTLTSSLFLMILFTQLTAVLHKYLNDKLKILCLLQFFSEVAQNSLRILWLFHVQRNPWVFQVYQVCGHPVVSRTATTTTTTITTIIIIIIIITTTTTAVELTR